MHATCRLPERSAAYLGELTARPSRSRAEPATAPLPPQPRRKFPDVSAGGRGTPPACLPAGLAARRAAVAPGLPLAPAAGRRGGKRERKTNGEGGGGAGAGTCITRCSAGGAVAAPGTIERLRLLASLLPGLLREAVGTHGA